MSETTRTFKKGDTVYLNVSTPDGWRFGKTYTVEAVRARRGAWRSGQPTAKVDGAFRDFDDLTHPDDLTEDQRAAIAAKNAERAREQAEADDSAARLRARNQATRDANRDKLDAAPVYGPVALGDSGWHRVSGSCKPIGSTFTYWTTATDKYGVLSVVQRSEWVGVRVEKQYHLAECVGFRESVTWGINMGGTTCDPTQAAIIAEGIRQALDLIPTLGDPNDRADA